jgi:hypothetical protein
VRLASCPLRLVRRGLFCAPTVRTAPHLRRSEGKGRVEGKGEGFDLAQKGYAKRVQQGVLSNLCKSHPLHVGARFALIRAKSSAKGFDAPNAKETTSGAIVINGLN